MNPYLLAMLASAGSQLMTKQPEIPKGASPEEIARLQAQGKQSGADALAKMQLLGGGLGFLDQMLTRPAPTPMPTIGQSPLMQQYMGMLR